MINIAIVEDDKEQAAELEAVLKQYSDEHKTPLQISVFYNPIVFLEKYTAEYDIVYMDIMMPMMNGMDASRIIREKDDQVMIIFVTSMQQFAVQGYEVGAFDFIVKPVSYPEFQLKFTRVLGRLPQKETEDILVRTDTGFVRLSPAQIAYVEVRGHHCVYYTKLGDYRQYQTMKSVESQLEPCGFVKCNNFLLVNLAFVTKIEGMSVFVGDKALQMSHPRRKEFSQRFTEFTGSRKYE